MLSSSMMKKTFHFAGILLMWWCGVVLTPPAHANIPGGGNGTGPNVTVTDNGNGTVTMANGKLSIVITKASATIHQIYYTYNNSGTTVTNQVLAGGKNGGMFYWEFGGYGSGVFTYSLVTNNGNYAEVDLFSDSATNGTVDIRYSMFRGSPGFYVAPVWSHRAQDPAKSPGEMRDNIYLSPSFNWSTVNAARDLERGLGEVNAPAFASPGENSLVLNGPRAGTYEDKYKGLAMLSGLRVWGWSSVSDAAWGVVGNNIGIWHVKPSSEYDVGGPMNFDLTDAPMVNMIGGSHGFSPLYSGCAAGEVWSRASGPYFIYLNNITNTITDPVQASRALWADAQAQSAAEISAWPYSWFKHPSYAPAAQRGVVKGRFVINDSGNPNASASNLWVGVVSQQDTNSGAGFDFQTWGKVLQFWARSDASGNFIISNIVAGNNYTLYAFGPGAAGTFMSQHQNGGDPPLSVDVPASGFSVTVTAGATNNLGTVTWTPFRAAATVFEIGVPDRLSAEFRHGDDYFVGDIGPATNAPSPIWTKFLEYPFDFPNGPNYVVGQSRWSTDWNFIQPAVGDLAGNFNSGSTSTITFNLATAPTNGTTVSLYLGIAGNYAGPMIVRVNGQNLGSTSGVTATPQPITSTGFNATYSGSHVSVREGNHGTFSDERIYFPATLLHAGQNTISLNMRRGVWDDCSLYDYVRLEINGYVPPPPSGVAAYAGNNAVLLSWPVTPGATSYNILRSTTSGSGYVSITNGVAGPVCGSGPQNATYVDSSAANGATYYYKVQSVNPTGASTNSPASGGVTPSASLSSAAPAAPTGLTVTSANNAVTLAWSASPGANYYTVQRGTVVNQLGHVPFYVILSNTTTNTTYTDASGTLGCTYSYFVTATSAGGTSGASTTVTAKPVPPPPATPPANVRISTTVTSTNQSARVTWSPVNGAVGYILYRASNSPAGPFLFPANYVMSMTATNYTDGGLKTNTLFSYTVIAMNAGGVSGSSTIVSTPPAAPVSLNAYPGNTQISLRWSPVIGATNYVILRGTNSGNETVVVAGTTNTTYTDAGLLNGTNYFYVVYAVGTGGNSIYSPEASAAPFAGPPPIYWINAITTSAQGWNVNTNWSNGTAFPNSTQATAIVNSPITAGQTINLNQSITVGNLSVGASGGAFNLTGNGGSLTFDDTPGQSLLMQLSASKGDTISAPVILKSDLNVSNASANTLTLAGVISGTNGINYLGPGPVTLTNNNTYTGDTLISYATVNLANDAANANAFGTGDITLDHATLNMRDDRNSYNSASWNLIVPAGSVSTLNADSRVNLYGTLTGDGILNIYAPYVRTELDGDWSAFTGQINVTGQDFRVNNTNGYAKAAINLAAGVNAYSMNGSMAVGEMSGAAGSTMSGTAWTIGALNTDAVFAGNITGNSITKVGTGAWTLSGTNNVYTGGTTINGGILVVNSPNASGTGTGVVTVNFGGALAGDGNIAGPVTVNSGGALAPGNPLGVLTISNHLTLASGCTTFAQVQHTPLTNDAVKVTGVWTAGGTLSVTNSGVAALAAGDVFKLFTAGTYTGAFANYVLPTLATNLAWETSRLNVDGTLWVVSTLPPVIAQTRLAGGNLISTGGGGTPNWYYYVLASTNLALPPAQWTRLATNRFDGVGNFRITNAISPNASQWFYTIRCQ